MARVVINYRREDTAAYAGRLYDRLVQDFGEDQVFIDIDTIAPGVDFVRAIQQAIGKSDVVIVIIGRQWSSITDETGARRLDSPTDFVRLEIEAALERQIRIVPVLVGGASMPTSDDLPESLADLTRRQAIEISDARFHTDVDSLIEPLREVVQIFPSPSEGAAAPVSPDPSEDREVATPLGPLATRAFAYGVSVGVLLVVLLWWLGRS